MSALEELTRLAAHPARTAEAHVRERGAKAVGFLCSHVPEEILHAAGVLPVRLSAPDCAGTPTADGIMSKLNCSFVRSCLEYLLAGKYDFLDGIVFTNSCDHARRLYDVLRETKKFPFMHFLSLPHKVGGQDVTAWYRGEIAAFAKNVEETFDSPISDASLKRSIEIYDETRALMGKLYDLRKSDAPPLKGSESLAVVTAGYAVPRERYNDLLRSLLAELDGREGVSGTARLMIAGGGGCDHPGYFGVMEALGGTIVTDSLCTGSRSFRNPVGAGGDRMLGLAQSYLERPCCANMTDRVVERCDFIKDMVARFGVDGVVFQRIRYCDIWGGQLLVLERELKEAGIPLLVLEREYALGGTAQLETRIQAFIERLEEGKDG